MRVPVMRIILCGVLTIALWLCAFADSAHSLETPGAQTDAAGMEFFEAKIRPVLVKHCYECHSDKAVRLRGGLRVDLRDGLRAGGESGEPTVVPGKAEEGTLLSALRHESYEMPPAGRLSDQAIRDFEQWIRMGAPDPRHGTAQLRKPHAIDLEAARKQWVFQPPQASELPRLEPGYEAWAKSDIDRFVASKLQQLDLPLAPDADRLTRLRRLTYDLTGLPPTPERIRTFQSDTSPDAWTREVDRLLATPQFAERWARHWLDVARFAESSGGGRSLMFPHAWRYRDYVIEAFRKDKPFDQFLTEQIAGDLLPYDTQQQRNEQLVATGYLVLGAINYELQDKELLVMEVIDEQLEAIGRGFLGMTMACARCHDHKFDPIPTRDYYGLAAIFSSTKAITPGNVSGYVTRELSSETERERVADYQARLAAAKRQLANGEKELAERRQALQQGLSAAHVVDNRQAELKGTWVKSTHYKTHVGPEYIHDQKMQKGECSASFATQLPKPGKYEVLVAYNDDASRAPKVPVAIRHAEGETQVLMNQQRAPSEPPYTSLGEFEFSKDARVVISNEGTDGFVVIVDAVAFRPVAPAAEATETAEQSAELMAAREAIDKAERAVKAAGREVAALEKAKPPEAEVAMGVDEAANPSDGRVRVRGQVRVLGDPAPRENFLSVIPPVDDASLKIGSHESGRLQLARWMTSAHHPLTSRVYANRIWGHLLGTGIVATPDNFGVMGAEPTHPELLDHLAVEFQRDGWSTKRLIRRIVLSRVYQLSSIANDTQRAADPQNHLLSHAHRRRLDAESLRDSMLLASGVLEPCDGGRTIKKLSAYDLGYQFGNVRERSIFVPAFRNARLEMLDVFDSPNPNLVTGRRAVSTLPTQALFMLNSPFVSDMAETTAKRLLALQVDGPQDRLTEAFLLLLNREPSSEERAWGAGILQLPPRPDSGIEQKDRLDRWTRLVQLVFASIDYRYLY